MILPLFLSRSWRTASGGMVLACAEMRHLGGFVVNGAVRDMDDIRASGNLSAPTVEDIRSALEAYKQTALAKR